MTKPLKYDHEKVKKKLRYVFPALWLLGGLSLFPNISMTDIVDGVCVLYANLHSETLLTLTTPYYTSVSCVVPAMIMFYAYTAIFISIKKSRKFHGFQGKPNEKGSTASDDNLRKAQVNLLQTCVILMLMFVLCWLWLAIMFMLYTIGYFKTLYTDYYHAANTLLVLNSCLNPYVYSIRYEEFRQQLIYLVH